MMFFRMVVRPPTWGVMFLCLFCIFLGGRGASAEKFRDLIKYSCVSFSVENNKQAENKILYHK